MDSPLGRWRYRALYVGLAAAITVLHLAPLEPGARGLPGPDLVLALTCAWVLRRPEQVPVPLIAAVILATDLLLMRPPGLWTAGVVIATEFLRSRALLARDRSFLSEWLLTGVTVAALVCAYGFVLALLAAIRPPLGLALVEMAATIAVYPVVAWAATRVLGSRRRRRETGEAAW